MNLKQYQDATSETNKYGQAINKLSDIRIKDNLNALILALGLNEESGEVASVLKKMVRDDKGILTPEKTTALKKELGDCLWYISELCNWFNFDLSEIMQINYDKLKDRHERGVIGESGDER